MTPYKAWDVFRLHGDGLEHEIAYADSRNEAKYKVLNHECKTDGELANDPDIEYLDLSSLIGYLSLLYGLDKRFAIMNIKSFLIIILKLLFISAKNAEEKESMSHPSH